MNSRIKFGPLAVFLVIITLVLSTLAVLTLVTSNADRVLAERYAEVTRIKYSLEEKGNRYLEKLDELLKEGGDPADAGKLEEKDGIWSHRETEEDYYLLMDFRIDGDSYDLIRWKIEKEWESSDPTDDIWKR